MSRVAVLIEPRTIELHEEPIPQAPPGGLLLRVRTALTDGTDLKTYRRGHPRMPFPTRFGHEFAGEVVAIGAGTSAFAVGDAVMCAHTAPCGVCFWCRASEEELCETVMATMVLGAYADYVAVPERIVACNAFHKPPQISFREAAFLEPLACVVRSVRMLEESGGAAALNGGSVAVVGDGAFGILHALLLRAAGARPLLVGRRDERLQMANAFGIETIDARSGDLAAHLKAGSRSGVDALFECTASIDVWEAAPSLVRRGGIVVCFGGLPSGTQVRFDAARLHYDEVRIVAPFHFAPRDVRRAYDLLAARAFDVLPLVTDMYPLERIVEAFSRLDGGQGMKAAIEP